MLAPPPSLRLCDAEPLLRDGDDLLLRARPIDILNPWTWPSYLLCVAGRTIYCHGAKLRRDQKTGAWKVVDFSELVGGRATNLDEMVAQYPGRWDVFRPFSEIAFAAPDGSEMLRVKFDASAAVDWVDGRTGAKYFWPGIWACFKRHAFIFRLFQSHAVDAVEKAAPKRTSFFCTHAMEKANREAGGFPLVAGMRADAVEPGDYSRSALKYPVASLMPNLPSGVESHSDSGTPRPWIAKILPSLLGPISLLGLLWRAAREGDR